jgi:hypothetical protein
VSRTVSDDILSCVEKQGIKAGGRVEYLKHLEGKRLTRGQAITAKCYECMGYFITTGKSVIEFPDAPCFPGYHTGLTSGEALLAFQPFISGKVSAFIMDAMTNRTIIGIKGVMDNIFLSVFIIGF